MPLAAVGSQGISTRNIVSGTRLSTANIASDMIIREVGNFIPQVRRHDNPMLSLVKYKGTKDQLKWEYGEGDLSPRTTTLNADLVTGGTTGVNVNFTHRERLQQYDLIKINDEVLLVTGAATSTGAGTIACTRAWGSTSDPGATHVSGTTVKILGPAVPEGVDAPASPVTRGDLLYTGPQIFEYTWEMTHRGRVVPDYEIKSDKFKYELKKKMKEAAEDLDALLLDGVYAAGTPGSEPSSMGGLREAIFTNVTDLNGDPFELVTFLDACQEVALDVGEGEMGKTVMVNYFMKRVINSWFQGSRRASKSDARLNLTWDEIECDFGVFKIVTNHKLDDDEIICWKPSDSGLYTIEGGKWSTGMYSTQGWFDKGFLRGDYGAIFEGDRYRFRIHDASTTKADYPALDIAA